MDEVTIDMLRRHEQVTALFRGIIDGTLDAGTEAAAAAGNPDVAFTATVIAAHLLISLVSAGFPRCRLHEILTQIQDYTEREFFAYQLRGIEAGENAAGEGK